MSNSEKHNPARLLVCGGFAEEVECIRNGKSDPSVALTSSIHLLALFLNLIHLAARWTCWNGFTRMMDVIVKNAKVNMWHGIKKEKTFFFKSESASHVSSSQRSDLPSFSNNIQCEDNCCVHAQGSALIFKTGDSTAKNRPVSLMTVSGHINYTEAHL